MLGSPSLFLDRLGGTDNHRREHQQRVEQVPIMPRTACRGCRFNP
jgi:hypothetical protein